MKFRVITFAVAVIFFALIIAQLGASLPPPTIFSSPQFRLLNHAGRWRYKFLQVLMPGASSWSNVCGNSASMDMAKLVCAQFGYFGSQISLVRGLGVAKTDTTFMTHGSCDASSTSLYGCNWTGSLPPGCSKTGEIAAFMCSKMGDQFSFHFVGKTMTPAHTEGTVILRDEATGKDYKTFYRLDVGDARRACHSLGYYGQAAPIHRIRYLRLPVLDRTGPASATSFDEASFFNNTYIWRDFFWELQVRCIHATVPDYRLVNGSARNSTAGVLQVRAPGGEWSIVCANGFNSNAAMAACRALGHHVTSPTQVSFATVTQHGFDFMYDDVQCGGWELHLGQCKHNGDFEHNCGADEAILLDCSSAPKGKWEYRTVNIDGTETPGVGRLEVKPPGPWRYGTVCDDGFDLNAARTFCRSIGYNYPFPTFTSGPRTAGTGRIHMDDVTCNGAESELSQCGHSRTSNCRHNEDVYIDCRSPLIRPHLAEDVSARKPLVRTGLVEGADAFAPSAAPAPMCLTNVTDMTATLICRKLSGDQDAPHVFGRAISSYASLHAKRSNRFVGQIGTCPANATDFTQDCPFTRGVGACSNSSKNTLGVKCFRVPDKNSHGHTSLEVKLISGSGRFSTSLRRLLTVRPSPDLPSGVVCMSGFSPATARAACGPIFGGRFSSDAPAKYFPASAINVFPPSSPYTNFNDPGASAVTYMRNVTCKSADSEKLSDCSYSSFASGNNPFCCSEASLAVAIDCGVGSYGVSLNASKMLEHTNQTKNSSDMKNDTSDANNTIMLSSSSSPSNRSVGAPPVVFMEYSKSYPNTVSTGLVEFKINASSEPHPICASNKSRQELDHTALATCQRVFERTVFGFNTLDWAVQAVPLSIPAATTNTTTAASLGYPLNLHCNSGNLHDCFYSEPKNNASSGMCSSSSLSSNGELLGATCILLPSLSRVQHWGAMVDEDGVLCVRPSKDVPWGRVWSDGFNRESAIAACNSAGLQAHGGDPRFSVIKNASEDTSAPIYMSSVSCTSESASHSHLDNCSFTYLPTASQRLPSHGVVMLDCRPPSTPEPTPAPTPVPTTDTPAPTPNTTQTTTPTPAPAPAPESTPAPTTTHTDAPTPASTTEPTTTAVPTSPASTTTTSAPTTTTAAATLETTLEPTAALTQEPTVEPTTEQAPTTTTTHEPSTTTTTTTTTPVPTSTSTLQPTPVPTHPVTSTTLTPETTPPAATSTTPAPTRPLATPTPATKTTAATPAPPAIIPAQGHVHVGTNASGNGFVELFLGWTASPFRICAPPPSSSLMSSAASSCTPISMATATALCRLSGVANVTHPLIHVAPTNKSASASASRSTAATDTMYVESLDCPLGATAVSNCSLSFPSGSCSTGYAVTVDCWADWQFRMWPLNGTVGLLQARHNSTAAWITVRDDDGSFGNVEATVACNSIGRFSSDSTGRVIRGYGSGESNSTSTGFITNVHCASSNVSSLRGCSWIWQHNYNNSYKNDMDVGLQCILLNSQIIENKSDSPFIILVACGVCAAVLVAIAVGRCCYSVTRSWHIKQQQKQNDTAPATAAAANEPTQEETQHSDTV